MRDAKPSSNNQFSWSGETVWILQRFPQVKPWHTALGRGTRRKASGPSWEKLDISTEIVGHLVEVFFLKANLQLLFFFPTPNMKNKCKSSNWINSLIFQGENHHTIATSLSVFYSVTNHDWSPGGRRPILFHDFKKVSEPPNFKTTRWFQSIWKILVKMVIFPR